MQLFVLWLMLLATAAARVPVKEFLEGTCHMYDQSMASQKQSIKKITLFVCSYDIRYKIQISAFLSNLYASNLYASNLFFSQSIENTFITNSSWLLAPSIPTPVFSLRILTLPETEISPRRCKHSITYVYPKKREGRNDVPPCLFLTSIFFTDETVTAFSFITRNSKPPNGTSTPVKGTVKMIQVS